MMNEDVVSSSSSQRRRRRRRSLRQGQRRQRGHNNRIRRLARRLSSAELSSSSLLLVFLITLALGASTTVSSFSHTPASAFVPWYLPDSSVSSSFTTRPNYRPRATQLQLHSSSSSSSSSLGPQDGDDDGENQDPFHRISSISSISSSQYPRHIALICDGNSRWAEQQQKRLQQRPEGGDNVVHRKEGHAQGAQRLVELIQLLSASDNKRYSAIEYCTFYGFSTENWNRSPQEIQDIFQIMEHTAQECLQQLLFTTSTSHRRRPIHFEILGDWESDDPRIPRSLVRVFQEVLKRQGHHHRRRRRPTTGNHATVPPLTVSFAINYGGRHDLVQAMRQVGHAIEKGDLKACDITQETIASHLSTRHLPDPDLLIRTSGEYRISNFLLWNLAYTELYVTPTLWPDFDQAAFQEALQWYTQRHRRFGSRSSAGEEGENHNPTPAAVTVTSLADREDEPSSSSIIN